MFADRFMALLPGKRVLDLGAGSGPHAAYFQSHGLDVLCIDLSHGMVDLCRKKGLKAEVGDLEMLELATGSYDGIWCHTALLHVPKAKTPRIVETMKQALVPGGILDVAVKGGEGEHMESHPDYPGSERFFVYFTEEELVTLFTPDFEIIRTDSNTIGRYTFINVCMRRKE
jgi:SAM-dependent methyltransferase